MTTPHQAPNPFEVRDSTNSQDQEQEQEMVHVLHDGVWVPVPDQPSDHPQDPDAWLPYERERLGALRSYDAIVAAAIAKGRQDERADTVQRLTHHAATLPAAVAVHYLGAADVIREGR